MFSLQRLLGGESKFYDLLEAGAQEAQGSVQALVALLNLPREDRVLDDLVLRRQREKRISQEITTGVCRTFVTPFDREDIEALSAALYKIPRTIEKFTERLGVAQSLVEGADFSRQIRVLQQTIEVLSCMVRELRSDASVEKVKEQNDRLYYFEQQADELMLEHLRELYSGKYDAVRVIALRDLYELLEKVIDRCRDCGTVVFRIVLKNS